MENSTDREQMLEKFIFELQKLAPQDAISEIGCSGLSDSEIAKCIKTITFSDTFKFNRK